jgi:hypothetical protein
MAIIITKKIAASNKNQTHQEKPSQKSGSNPAVPIEAWSKLDEKARRRLPLSPIYFLTPPD